MSERRPSTALTVTAPKRVKADGSEDANATALVKSVTRTSSLMSPIMLLTGHSREINALRFHPNGEVLASAGFDRQIYLWKVHGECKNFAVLPGHRNAVLQLAFNRDGSQLYTCSADKTVCSWDTESFKRSRQYKEHVGVVNDVSCTTSMPSHSLLSTVSDDATMKVWDSRERRSVAFMQHTTALTACAISDDGKMVYTGGIDNVIQAYDMRRQDVVYSLNGHADTITSLRISPDGTRLLSNSMDSTNRIWDIRPYAPSNRFLHVLSGAQHNFEKLLLRSSWSADGTRVGSGSSDRFVYVFDAANGKIEYRLPGHAAAVTDVEFHPSEPIIASCSTDKQIFLGEIETK